MKLKLFCWYCDKPITVLWKIKKKNRKILFGGYCSKACAESDAYGPDFKGSIPKRVALK